MLHALGREAKEALECFDRAVELDPGNARAHSGKGDVLHALGREAEALECFDRAVELDPDNARAHSGKDSVP